MAKVLPFKRKPKQKRPTRTVTWYEYEHICPKCKVTTDFSLPVGYWLEVYCHTCKNDPGEWLELDEDGNIYEYDE